ncbi:hypothetical protein [Collinsella tanakaei]|uniref:hypothetical protein n=1 Tax=Collinsella tanakaei TaxID=626935 RepID=UPI0025A36779|nr:hypothetical protein [Collinsella tanakaei]MDM8300102.1 hypothetical protein [Collinsella tanakaei]
MSIASMESQLDGAHMKLRELEEERDGLARFMTQVNNDRAEFEGQLARKRAAASKVRAVRNAKLARGLADYLDAKLGSSFSGGIEGCFTGVSSNAARAMAQVADEIAQVRSQISSLEQGIAAEKQRIAQEEQRRAAEAAVRAAETARASMQS